MNERERFLSFLGIARKAGKLPKTVIAKVHCLVFSFLVTAFRCVPAPLPFQAYFTIAITYLHDTIILLNPVHYTGEIWTVYKVYYRNSQDYLQVILWK